MCILIFLCFGILIIPTDLFGILCLFFCDSGLYGKGCLLINRAAFDHQFFPSACKSPQMEQ
ncbi:MAG: hypothetical protein DRH32_06760 [Deltaproteobacteria bacterium]|nr:MAG: hypothetical protein DRH32_06760 [Deltaproteobacteria bacterium]